jgi:hypothetical protein
MTQYILKNITNSPQNVGKTRIGARATSEPIDIEAHLLPIVERSGLFQVTPHGSESDAFDAMNDDELRELYEVVKGKKPHHKLSRAKLLETVRADGV